MKNHSWILEILLGILAFGLAQYGVKALIARLEKRYQTGWKARLGKILQIPLSSLFWILGILYLIDVIGDYTGFSSTDRYIHALQKASAIGCVVWIFYRWKREVELVFQKNPSKRVDLTTIQMVSRLATIGVGMLAALIILQTFGINVTPLLAFGSVGAASLGFASKDVIANFCSGILLQMSRPFIIGDFITLPEKNLSGSVEDIGWFRTSIRDTEKRIAYLPNNLFSTLLLINSSRVTHRHIKQQLKIRFKDIDKLPELASQMKAHLEKHPEIDPRSVYITLKAFGDYACEIDIDAYSTTLDPKAFVQFQNTMLLELIGILKEAGVQLAIPVMHWQQES